MKFFDEVFDPKYTFDFSYMLSKKNIWCLNNIANRKSFPNGDIGSHLLLGHQVFVQESLDFSYDKDLAKKCFETFNYICLFEQKKMKLKEINLNLQMAAMDGTFHYDGNENETIYLIMLSPHEISKEDGGEFINQTLNQVVPFKNGRLIKFKASDIHKGLAFNKINKARFSMKFRTEEKYE
tara:strand:- start:431 stop:973 length:543 start_codon:yes stop_codon:yes gene_type:complete